MTIAQRQLRWVVMLAAIAGFTIMIPWYFSPSFGHDQMEYLIEARRWLDGAEIYGPRIVEISLPLIIWVSAIPVMLASWLHRTGSVHALEILILRLLVLALIAASVVWSLRLVRRSGLLRNGLAVLFFGLALVTAFFRISPYDFGQREHLLVLALTPYLLALVLRVGDRLSWKERLALGLVAGVSMWFKPQAVLIPLVLQMVMCVRERSLRPLLRPEFVGLVAGCFAVLALMIMTAPLYFHWIPILKDTYWAFADGTPMAMARTQAVPVLGMIALIAAAYALRRRMRDWTVAAELAVCGIAASVVYDIQRANWPYHLYPAEVLMGLSVVWFALDAGGAWLERLSSDDGLAHRTTLVLSGALVLALVVVAVHPKLIMHMREVPRTDLETYLAGIEPGSTAWVMSTEVMPLAVVYRHDLRWGSRFAHLWMVPALVQSKLGPLSDEQPFKRLPPERVQQLAQLQQTDVAEDLASWKPTVVAVQQCTTYAICEGIGPRDVDLLAWFMQSDGFRQQWMHYRKEYAGDGFVFYRRVN
jgi:hypothetical protein